MPSPACQTARKPEQVRGQGTVGDSTVGFATLDAPPGDSSGDILKAANHGKQPNWDCTSHYDFYGFAARPFLVNSPVRVYNEVTNLLIAFESSISKVRV